MSTGQIPPPAAIRLASNETQSSASFKNASSVDLAWYPYTTNSVNPPAYLVTCPVNGKKKFKTRKKSGPSEVILKLEWIFEKSPKKRLRFKFEQRLVAFDAGRPERSLHQPPLTARLITVWGKSHNVLATAPDRTR